MSTDPEGPRRERNPVAAVVRLLAALAEHDAPSAGVRELARILDTAPSSVQRTIEAARDVSLVSPAPNGQWELGWELYRIAAIAQSKRPFQAAAAVLEELADQTAETALLTVYDPHRHTRMFAAAALSRHAVRFAPTLFAWMPAYAGASALAILAHRPKLERQAAYATADAFPDVRAPRPASIERVLRTIRDRGYAISHDEVNLGASAVAAPIPTAAGITSSVAIIAPKQRLDATPHDNPHVTHVLNAAAELSRRIGNPLAPLDVVS